MSLYDGLVSLIFFLAFVHKHEKAICKKAKKFSTIWNFIPQDHCN